MDTYHWDILVTNQWDVVGSLIWVLFKTSWTRTDEALLLSPLETSYKRRRHSNKMPWRRSNETSWRRSIETLLGVSFEMYLRRRWDVETDVVMTSPQRFVAGRDYSWYKINKIMCLWKSISTKKPFPRKWLNFQRAKMKLKQFFSMFEDKNFLLFK